MSVFPPDKFCFLSEPDRYGRFGHQTFSLLSSWCFAHRFNASFLPNQYSYFAEKYNDHVNFSLSERAICDQNLKFSRYHRLKGMAPDIHGNTKYILNCDSIMRRFVADLQEINNTIPGQVCVQLPFDQTAGVLMQSMTKSMHNDLLRIFRMLKPTPRYGPEFHIVIHVRRGDVNPSSHPDWYIADHYYISLLESLYKCYGNQIAVSMLIQGQIRLDTCDLLRQQLSSGRLRVNITQQMWTNDNEIQDFSTMLGADLLIAGQSSFSQLAALVQHGRIPICIINNEASLLPHPLDIDFVVFAEKELFSSEQSMHLVRSKLAKLIDLPFISQ